MFFFSSTNVYEFNKLHILLFFNLFVYRCTDGFSTKTAQISIFGIPLWYQSNTPRTAISPTVRPGECWAFRGFPGFLGKLIYLHIIIIIYYYTLLKLYFIYI